MKVEATDWTMRNGHSLMAPCCHAGSSHGTELAPAGLMTTPMLSGLTTVTLCYTIGDVRNGTGRY